MKFPMHMEKNESNDIIVYVLVNFMFETPYICTMWNKEGIL